MPNKRPIAACDAETDPFKIGRIPKPFLWGYYDGTEFLTFTETKDFVQFCASRRQIVYAHNGGKFDFHFLLDHFDTDLPVTVINNRIVSFKIGECEFRDSFSILPTALSAHDKGEIDYRIMEAGERDKQANRKEIIDYLKRDCASLYDWAQAYIAKMGLNLTLASGAYKHWQSKYCPRGLAPSSNAEFYDQFYPYYYGGRVQCFQSGIIEHPFVVSDINSAYPYAMLSPHPISTTWDTTRSGDYSGASLLHVRAKAAGAFPYRGEDKSLSFPDDECVRDFFISGWELQAAEDLGLFLGGQILSVTNFHQTIQFGDYVDAFYAEKLASKTKGDLAAYWIAKFHLNALYGKFAANPRNYDEYRVVTDDEFWDRVIGGEWCDAGEIEFTPYRVIARPIPEEKQKFYNIATAASITGYVRAMLMRAVALVDNPIYCDTDSIAAYDVSALSHGLGLGQWEIEAQCDLAAVAGKKLYAFRNAGATGWSPRHWKIASKGARLSPADIHDIASGKVVEYEAESPTFSFGKSPRFLRRKIAMTA